MNAAQRMQAQRPFMLQSGRGCISPVAARAVASRNVRPTSVAPQPNVAEVHYAYGQSPINAVSFGPSGSWFLSSQDGQWSSTLPVSLKSDMAKAGQPPAFVSLGSSSDWFVRYGDNKTAWSSTLPKDLQDLLKELTDVRGVHMGPEGACLVQRENKIQFNGLPDSMAGAVEQACTKHSGLHTAAISPDGSWFVQSKDGKTQTHNLSPVLMRLLDTSTTVKVMSLTLGPGGNFCIVLPDRIVWQGPQEFTKAVLSMLEAAAKRMPAAGATSADLAAAQKQISDLQAALKEAEEAEKVMMRWMEDSLEALSAAVRQMDGSLQGLSSAVASLPTDSPAMTMPSSVREREQVPVSVGGGPTRSPSPSGPSRKGFRPW